MCATKVTNEVTIFIYCSKTNAVISKSADCNFGEELVTSQPYLHVANRLALGFVNGALQSKSDPPGHARHVWPVVSFKVHRNRETVFNWPMGICR